MNIIGITGQAGAGKDTAADRLVSDHGFVKVSLADPLKRYCREVYDFTEDQLWGPSSSRNAPDTRYVRERHERHDWQLNEKDNNWYCTRCTLRGDQGKEDCIVYLTPRYALQLLGTEWGRQCYENTWVDLALRTAKAILTEGMSYTAQHGLILDATRPRPNGVVIADVRFWNELDGVRRYEGFLWRIKPAEALEAKESWRQHKSETQQAEIPDDRFDEVIVNRKVSYDVLYADVDAALARCLHPAG